jgi:hypothetical protein
MDIGGWLRSLGLEQYEAAFHENAIDFSVLPDLTDQDLEKLGVLLGHRRKLLRAIANLETLAKSASAPAVAAPVTAASRDTTKALHSLGDGLLIRRMTTAERRQVTS